MGAPNCCVSLVTGGASGIGRELCRLLAPRGPVVIADIDRDGAEALAAEIVETGDRASAHALDVRDATAVEALVAEVFETHGRLDMIFNNAGITVLGEVRDLELGDWNRVLDINLRGVVHGVHAAYPRMVEQGFGHIVNTASGYGLLAGPANVPYVASKFAVVGLSLGLRDEAFGLGVRVSAVCPGLIETPIIRDSPARGLDIEHMLAGFPYKPIPASEAAEEILRGVDRNQSIIAFPSYVRWMVRAQSLMPAMVRRMNLKMMARLRRNRQS